jgi:hypothetical protein
MKPRCFSRTVPRSETAAESEVLRCLALLNGQLAGESTKFHLAKTVCRLAADGRETVSGAFEIDTLLGWQHRALKMRLYAR